MKQITKREQAKRDLEECFVYIAENHLDAAVPFLVHAEESFDLLAEMPYIGRLANLRSPFLVGLRPWRVSGFESYLIYYRIGDKGVEVLRFLQSKRNLAEII